MLIALGAFALASFGGLMARRDCDETRRRCWDGQYPWTGVGIATAAICVTALIVAVSVWLINAPGRDAERLKQRDARINQLERELRLRGGGQ